MSNLSLMFSKRSELIALSFFDFRSLIDSGDMSAAKTKDAPDLRAVSDWIPEPAPISRKDLPLANFFTAFSRR